MKNHYEIYGEITKIFLKRRNGDILTTIIDTADLPRAQEFKGAWCAMWSKNTRSFRVVGFKSVSFPRWLTNCPEDLVVDHFNHDTLDNRRSTNLRIVTPDVNATNKQPYIIRNKNPLNGKTSPGKVYWKKSKQRWEASFQFNYKYHYVGLFDTEAEARKAAISAKKLVFEKWLSQQKKAI